MKHAGQHCEVTMRDGSQIFFARGSTLLWVSYIHHVEDDREWNTSAYHKKSILESDFWKQIKCLDPFLSFPGEYETYYGLYILINCSAFPHSHNF